MMQGDSAIVNAEKKMGINRFANPYFVQVILLGFVLGPVLVGGAIAQTITKYNPQFSTGAATDGWIATGLIWMFIIAYGLKTFQVANSSKWFELSYCGAESDVDWSSSFRMGKPVPMGEAVPLAVPVAGESALKGILSGTYGRVPRPENLKNGQCWEIPFYDKNLPAILAWLPDEFEKCFNFEGHLIQAFFRGFPFNIENGTRGTFIRTSFTQDPNGVIIPIGVFSHNDFIARQLRRKLEPVEPPKAEVQGLAQTRDNFYRHGLALELDFKNKEIERLNTELRRRDDDSYEKAGALFQAAKGRHKTEPERIGFTVTKRRQGLILVVAVVLIVAALLFTFKVI